MSILTPYLLLPLFIHLFLTCLCFLQDHFVLVVSEFMYIPWEHTKAQAANRASLQEPDSCTPSVTVAAAEAFESRLVEYLKGKVQFGVSVATSYMISFSLMFLDC